MTYDLVIRGGLIVAGTRAEPNKADIGLSGDRIAVIGAVIGDALTEIDTTGKIVTPGFVDIHTHYDGQPTGVLPRRVVRGMQAAP